MSTLAASRVIPLDAVHNFRDLGGYPTTDGRVTRWRRLFRADGLYRLTPEDLEVVRELGIHTVLDLRTPNELVERGRFPVEDHPVDFHHLPMIDVIWDPAAFDASQPPADFLLDMYRFMLESAEVRVAKAFQVLAMPGALPAVFHCAAGKDRTGIMAGLVLSSLGVSDADVVADYALTDRGDGPLHGLGRAGQPRVARPAGQPARSLHGGRPSGHGRPARHHPPRARIGAGVRPQPRRPVVVLTTLEDELLEVA